MTIKPYTLLETIDIMLCETQNELSKCKIMERLCNRMALSGQETFRQAQGANQSKIANFKKTLDQLIDIRQDIAKEETEKGI